ncbi:MAG: hypothetical protein ABIA04_06320 [Pseudomonadota bacterium]
MNKQKLKLILFFILIFILNLSLPITIRQAFAAYPMFVGCGVRHIGYEDGREISVAEDVSSNILVLKSKNWGNR